MLEKTAVIFIKISIKDSGKGKRYSNYALNVIYACVFFLYNKSF